VEATVRRFGAALGAHLLESGVEPLVLIAGDTRASTPLLVAWAAEGLATSGARPVDLGVLPTPAVAQLVVTRAAASGLVVSASHNPAGDNGLKLIGRDGFKWESAAERDLEARIDATRSPAAGPPPQSDASGRDEYLDALIALIGRGRPLDGLRIALDTANGAASALARDLFEGLGAHIELMAAEPDGRNINLACGSTHPQALALEMRRGGFDLGFAFDGDADRAILLDGDGQIRDGDAMLVLWATELERTGLLVPPRIVATSMSNLGLEHALAPRGIGVERCEVGDRAVVEMLRGGGLRLGGEQSGHIVDLAQSTTGDGLLTAATLSAIVARSGRAVADLLAGFERFPQVLLNVPVRSKPRLDSIPAVAAAAAEVARTLGTDGRLVLRYSGTEPLARVMLEGPDAATIDRLAQQIAAAIRAEIGAA